MDYEVESVRPKRRPMKTCSEFVQRLSDQITEQGEDAVDQSR